MRIGELVSRCSEWPNEMRMVILTSAASVRGLPTRTVHFPMSLAAIGCWEYLILDRFSLPYLVKWTSCRPFEWQGTPPHSPRDGTAAVWGSLGGEFCDCTYGHSAFRFRTFVAKGAEANHFAACGVFLTGTVPITTNTAGCGKPKGKVYCLSRSAAYDCGDGTQASGRIRQGSEQLPARDTLVGQSVSGCRGGMAPMANQRT